MITLVRCADARTKGAVGQHAEGRVREQRGGAQGRGVRCFCACGAGEAWRVILGAVWGRDG
jgi:hypothetical protein